MSDNAYIEILKARYNAVRDELRVLHEQHSVIVDQMAAKQDIARHLSELLAAEGHDVDDLGPGSGQSRPVDLAFVHLDQQDGHPLTPIHYREMARVLISDGVMIGGKDPAATLLAQISRDNRFVRVGPGKYALAKWKIKPRVSARSRRRKRRR